MQLFKDRRDAGRKLAEMLMHYAGQRALVLAVPRGGVVIGEEIAAAIGAELDLVISRKIGSPTNPEAAIGAVSHDNCVEIDRQAVKKMRVLKGYIDRMVRMECIEVYRRNLKYRGGREPAKVDGRVVIVVDDGIATGYTLIAALKFLRKYKPKKLVVAVPLASPGSLKKVERLADEVVCLELPSEFISVGEFYKRFNQVTDDEVINILRRASDRVT